MANSYIQSIDVNDILTKYGTSTSYTASVGTSYLDFTNTSVSQLSEYYFNISPRLSNAVFNNLIEKLASCENISSPVTNYEEILSHEVNTEEYNYYKYSNSVYSNNAVENLYSNVDNKYLLKFEDITCKDDNNTVLTLDSDTNISSFIQSISSNNTAFTSISDFNGAFLYPDLDSMSQITTDENSYLIKAGDSIEIPITFEYFIDADSFDKDNIKKTIVFTLKDSLYQDEKYFELEITGNINSLNTSSIYTSSNNVDLSKELSGDLL